MANENGPRIVERSSQTYVGVRRAITMETFPEIADRLPELLDWLGSTGVAPVGPPFFRYDVIDMWRELIVEAGVPVAAAVAIDEQTGYFSDNLPAGRYATVHHIGHPSELVDATAALLRWAEERGQTWDMAESPDGEVWGCRLEVLLTDPAEQPDMNRWETQLVFRLAD